MLVKKIEETRNPRQGTADRQAARERSKAVSIRIPQLKDCKSHLDPRRKRGLDSMLFITEGLSAAGSITACRNVLTQGVFTLRGKPPNVAELNRDAIYTNEELYNPMRALNIEESSPACASRKSSWPPTPTWMAHIRNLLLTFSCASSSPPGARRTPLYPRNALFRVRNKKETRYCYSEAERDAAAAALRGPEVTRFKGLGEISPGEFKHFIGPQMRLTPVEVAFEHKIPTLLRFYMGRNTPERRQFIMEHLRIEAEA